MSMFLPPQDYAGLTAWIQVMADPKEFQKKLDTLKSLSEKAEHAFKQAQPILKDIEKAQKAVAYDRDQLEKEKASFSERTQAQREELDKQMKDLEVRLSTVTLKERAHEDKVREDKAMLSKQDADISVREKTIVAREAKVAADRDEIEKVKADLSSRLAKLKAIAG